MAFLGSRAFGAERDVPGERKLDESIFIVSSAGGEPRQLTHHTNTFCELEAWSPAGDSTAHTCSDRTIRIIPAKGGEPTAINTGLDGNVLQFALSPDGARIAFNAPSGNEPELWLMEDFLSLIKTGTKR